MPSVTNLPQREGTIDFTDDYVESVAVLFNRLARGEAVTIDDFDPLPTESMARTRARVLADKLRAHYGMLARTHTVEAVDGEGKPIKVDAPVLDDDGKPTGRTHKVDGIYPALSVNQSRTAEQTRAARAQAATNAA